MARRSSKCLFLFPLSLLIICSSGTLMGFSYHANVKTADSLSIKTSTFFKLKKVAPPQIKAFAADNRDLISLTKFGALVYLFLNEDQINNNVLHSEPSAISLPKLKAQTLAFHPQARLEGIILGFGYQNVGPTELLKISSTLDLVHGVINSKKKMKVSVAFPLAFLEKLGKDASEDLHRLFSSIEELASMVIIEDNITSEAGDREKVVRSVIQRALLAGSLFSPNHIPLVLSLKTPVFHSTAEGAQLIDSVLKSLESNGQIKRGQMELYIDVSDMRELSYQDVRYKRPVSYHRGLLSQLKHNLHDLVTSPVTTFPVTPVSATPVATPATPTPTIITVPSTTPVTTTPENPPAAPIIFPPPDPVAPPVPITSPATTPIAVPGAQPVTNPVTTYPSPAGGVPVTTPVTNPVTPPVTTNAPAVPVQNAPAVPVQNAPVVPGQSWCVARSGVSETVLQQALDYACGIGGADCSQIQPGASCYEPNSLQNHASYAFNSYYQKNPAATSCDFGGTATVVNVNPSVGSCTYPTYSLSSAPATTTTTPVPTTASLSPPSTGVPISSSGTPPAVVNPVSTSPTGFTLESPLAGNASSSISLRLQPYSYTGCVVFLTTLVAAKLTLGR